MYGALRSVQTHAGYLRVPALALLAASLVLLAACGPAAPAATPTANVIVVTATFTAVPPTATAVPPTATSVPPTATAVPPTSTPPPPTPTVKPTETALSHLITNGVMAKDVKGDNFDPLGITDTFPADQSIFHAVITIADAPANTKVKAVWTVVDIGDASQADKQMAEYELATEGSRNLDFTFKPNNGSLPAGSYKTDIYVNGTLDRTLTFTVEGAVVEATPTVEVTPGSVIVKITMAEDTTGDDKHPVNPTTVFKPDSTFHAVVAIQDAPADTTFGAAWYVTDVGTAAAKDTKIDSTELVTDGTRNIDFTLKPDTTWPVGTYRVEISVGGEIEQVVDFSVEQ